MTVNNQVNISGGKVQGFIQENHGTVTQNFIYQVSELISGPTSPTKQSLTQTEYRQRQVLLSKVQEYWVKGVLDKSLYSKAMIELGLEKRNDAVERPFSGFEELPETSRDIFPTGTNTTEVFNEIGEGRTLLILGEPGAGKTITLLKLAQDLITRSQENESYLIPVVFNLSSWENKRETIAHWLVKELFKKYQVPQKVGQNWIEKQQLILLLDGLDEVKANQREACVEAINQFMQDYGQTEMVVCSRIADYEVLSNRLQLRGAIYIRSLTPEQVKQYIDSAGEKLEALKTVLSQDSTLQELAKSPLTLSVMTLAYQDKKVEQILQTGSIEVRRKHLFNAYIERMFNRKQINQEYSKDQTKKWLTWLAKRMSKASKTIFLIEEIQPTWLQNKVQNFVYRVGTTFVGIIVIALISCLGWVLDAHNTWLNLFNTLSLNSLAWGFVLFINFGWGKAEIKTFETLTWPWKKSPQELLNGLKLGLGWSCILCPMGAVWCVLTCRDVLIIRNTIYGLILGFVFTLMIGLIHGLKGSEIERKSFPNQGILRSAGNSIIVVLGSWIMLSVIIFAGFPMGLQSKTSIITWGLMLGLLFGGGIAVIQHFSLRFIFGMKGFIPINLVRFLDYSTERIFMQKVGGGYIFIHRMLLEHFARMNYNETRDAQNSPF